MQFMGAVQEERHPMWDRLALIRFALEQGNDMVVWMDSDALIVNPSADLRECAKEFSNVGMCRHPERWKKQSWHFNMGVSFYKNTNRTWDFLYRIHQRGQVDHPNWKIQATMMEVNDELKIVERIDDKWNSTYKTNESRSPVIQAWHGKRVFWRPVIKKLMLQLTYACRY